MRFALSFLILMVLSGCATKADYQVALGNENTRLPVQDVKLLVDGTIHGEIEEIAPSKVKGTQPRKGNLPRTLSVIWKDDAGETYQKTVHLDDATPPDFKGQFVLEITKENTLTLIEIPSEEEDYSVIPWGSQEPWEGSVSVPGMN